MPSSAHRHTVSFSQMLHQGPMTQWRNFWALFPFVSSVTCPRSSSTRLEFLPSPLLSFLSTSGIWTNAKRVVLQNIHRMGRRSRASVSRIVLDKGQRISFGNSRRSSTFEAHLHNESSRTHSKRIFNSVNSRERIMYFS